MAGVRPLPRSVLDRALVQQLKLPVCVRALANHSDVCIGDFLCDLRTDPWRLNNVVNCGQAKQQLQGRLPGWIKAAEGYRPAIPEGECAGSACCCRPPIRF